MVEAVSRVTGLKAEYRSAYTREGLLTYFPLFAENSFLADETIGMVEYAAEFGYFGRDRDLEWSRRIDPHTLTSEQFVRNTDWRGERVAFGS